MTGAVAADERVEAEAIMKCTAQAMQQVVAEEAAKAKADVEAAMAEVESAMAAEEAAKAEAAKESVKAGATPAPGMHIL
eukprot:CAMPEP_0119074944 /NCGR_PEP_ID=MMETSP1178-20130426/75137_1 /TAXON_ID=33656 /ORGANISM="unid sp, Strain CCMP2000" /LENGTH=78 /DNA_ID=CAMNT_0007057135 /DNA_START=27 /DNA_END=260 /DNA_ORIENTATION=+